MSTSTISTVFGTLGAICWSIQLLPQIYLNHRTHSARGLSGSFMLCWACAGIPLGAYNIAAGLGVALTVQPQILTALSLLTWAQCRHYQRGTGAWRAVGMSAALAGVCGGVEAGLVVALRAATARGLEWPKMLMAVLAAALLALGVLEQYLAIWRNRSVEGISFLFCGIDAMGDLTSIVSVVYGTGDLLGLVTYGVEFVLWVGVFMCGFYFGLLPKMRKHRQARRVAASGPESNDEGSATGVQLQDLPSSTSVFRVPLADRDVRPVTRVGHSPAVVQLA